jgi:hypothetical protein
MAKQRGHGPGAAYPAQGRHTRQGHDARHGGGIPGMGWHTRHGGSPPGMGAAHPAWGQPTRHGAPWGLSLAHPGYAGIPPASPYLPNCGAAGAGFAHRLASCGLRARRVAGCGPTPCTSGRLPAACPWGWLGLLALRFLSNATRRARRSGGECGVMRDATSATTLSLDGKPGADRSAALCLEIPRVVKALHGAGYYHPRVMERK